MGRGHETKTKRETKTMREPKRWGPMVQPTTGKQGQQRSHNTLWCIDLLSSFKSFNFSKCFHRDIYNTQTPHDY